MSVDLPLTEHWSARVLAFSISEIQLRRAITYLELIRIKKISPGPELGCLLGTSSGWTMDDIDAMQRRLSLAICIKNRKGYLISKEISESVSRYKEEVLSSYNENHYRRYSYENTKRHSRMAEQRSGA